ncbi:hypothetical protein RMATCC62417_14249 [Rhizopus microsporus]|nr:hypothetical protein RMATCC62417_14249 [Rhizopus microsporus]
MKRKKDDDPPPPKAKRNEGKAVDREFPSLFAQTQTSLFKNTAFEASDDDFKKLYYLEKITSISSICFIADFAIYKNIRTTLKATKKDISAPGPSNVVTSNKTPMPTVNKDTSAQAVSPAPIPSTSCTSASIKTSKKYQGKVDKTEALKKEKGKNKTTGNEQKQVRCPSCGETDHSRSSSKLCPMNKSKTELPKPKGESTSLTQSELDKYASKRYMTTVSSMAKQYEALVRNYYALLMKVELSDIFLMSYQKRLLLTSVVIV